MKIINEERGIDMSYPYASGDAMVLGAEVFASKDREVICWQGQNYIPQTSVLGDRAAEGKNGHRGRGRGRPVRRIMEAWRTLLGKPPHLTGYPQLVVFDGIPMRIVQMETSVGSQAAWCMNCGSNYHRQTVTLTLVDDETLREEFRAVDQ